MSKQKAYGLVNNVVESDGVVRLQLEDLNKQGNTFHVIYKTENIDTLLEDGQKVSLQLTKVGEDSGVTWFGLAEIIKVYSSSGSSKDDFQKRIGFGNCVNIAVNLVGYGDGSDEAVHKVFSTAYKLNPLVDKLRDTLLAEFKGIRDERDVGAKLGDALKHSSLSCKGSSGHLKGDVAATLEMAEKWVRLHIKAEDKL